MLDKKLLDKLLFNTGDMCLKRRAKEIVLSLDPKPNEVVLDAGCGDGFYLHLLSNLSKAKLVGLDDNPKALALAKNYVRSNKLKLVEGDVTKMPFKAGSFDKVICSEVLEHLPDDVAGLKEFKRIIKKGGKIAITVPSHNYPLLWDPVNWLLEHLFNFHFKNGFWAGVWNQHIRLYTPQSLVSAVESAGLTVNKIKVITNRGIPFNHFLLNIGYNIRKSKLFPKTITTTLNKFTSETKPDNWYQQLLNFIKYIDGYNDREFSLSTPTVGIFIEAQK